MEDICAMLGNDNLDLETISGVSYYSRKDTLEKYIVQQNLAGPYELFFSIEYGEKWYDIGANIGGFCLRACMQGVQEIIAFEPMPVSFEILEKNLEINNFKQFVTTYNYALVGSDIENVTIYEKTNNTGGCSMYDKENFGPIITVPAINVNKFNFDGWCIKMDCEGAEEQLIPNIDFRNVPKFACEYHAGFVGMDKYEWDKKFIEETFPNTYFQELPFDTVMISAWR